MTQNQKEETKVPENQEELVAKKEETKVPSIPKSFMKPSFPTQNQFGKGKFANNNFANKQRPGRAAGRGR